MTLPSIRPRGGSFLCLLPALIIGLQGWSAPTARAESRPNIVLIMTDDQGHGDFSLHGNNQLETPRLDALGRESTRFTRFFVHSVCAPTRASLMSGRHFNRVGVWGVHEGRSHMSRDVRTLAELLRDEGYFTAMVGKWHLGTNPGYMPWERGFDQAWTGTTYFNDRPYTLTGPDGEKTVAGSTTEEILTAEALAILADRPEDRPFFLYVAYNAPHHPWIGPENLVRKYRDRGLSEVTAQCYAEIESLDRAVGRLLDGLDADGLTATTTVFFLTDNGPHQGDMPEDEWRGRNPQNLRGQKGDLFDNAHRVPLFARWPGRFEARDVDAQCFVADLFPTLAELAGVDTSALPDGLAGRSLLPLIGGSHDDWPDRLTVDTRFSPTWDDSGRDREPDKSAMPFAKQGIWIRNNQYKAVQTPRGDRMLFDTLADPTESRDIAGEHPDTVDDLMAHGEAWWRQTVETPAAFRKPVAIIGHGGARHTRMRTVNFPEWRGGIGGWFRHENLDAPGDGFAGPVIVETPGTYAVSLHGGRQGREVGFRLTIGDQSIRDTVAFAPGDHQLGRITLPKGTHPLEFTLTDTTNGHIPDLYFIQFQRVE